MSENLDELREIVAQTLEAKGVLAKLRAQVRKHVFDAIDDQEPSPSVANERVASIRATPSSQIMLDLVLDYLEHFELDYTASVFFAEARVDDLEGVIVDRDDLRARAGLSDANESNEPVLAQLLTSFQSMQQQHQQPTTFTSIAPVRPTALSSIDSRPHVDHVDVVDSLPVVAGRRALAPISAASAPVFASTVTETSRLPTFNASLAPAAVAPASLDTESLDDILEMLDGVTSDSPKVTSPVKAAAISSPPAAKQVSPKQQLSPQNPSPKRSNQLKELPSRGTTTAAQSADNGMHDWSTPAVSEPEPRESPKERDALDMLKNLPEPKRKVGGLSSLAPLAPLAPIGNSSLKELPPLSRPPAGRPRLYDHDESLELSDTFSTSLQSEQLSSPAGRSPSNKQASPQKASIDTTHDESYSHDQLNLVSPTKSDSKLKVDVQSPSPAVPQVKSPMNLLETSHDSYGQDDFNSDHDPEPEDEIEEEIEEASFEVDNGDDDYDNSYNAPQNSMRVQNQQRMMYARDPIVDDERALAAKFDHSELIE